MRGTAVGLTLISIVFAVAACSDSTAPVSGGSKTVPRAGAQTRYILASGEVPPGCQDLGNGLWLCEEIQTTQATQATPAAPTDDNNDDGN